MTITSTTVQGRTDGDGATLIFNIPQTVQDEADIEVYLFNESTEQAALQTLDTHYTVDLDAQTITFVTEPTSSQKVFINVTLSQKQLSDLSNTDNLGGRAIEDQLDRMTQMIQWLQFQMNYCIRVTPNANVGLTVSPISDAAADRISKTIAFTSDGNDVELVS